MQLEETMIWRHRWAQGNFFSIASGFPQELISDFSVRCIFPDKTVKKIPVTPNPIGSIEFKIPFSGRAPGTYHFLIDLKTNLPSGIEHRSYYAKILAVWEEELSVLAI